MIKNKYCYVDEEDAKNKEKIVYQQSKDLYEALMKPVRGKSGLYGRPITVYLKKDAQSSGLDIDELVKKVIKKELHIYDIKDMNNKNILSYDEYCYIYVFQYFYELGIEFSKE